MVATAWGSDWMICSGLGDAVPVAGDGLEGVVDRDGRIVELLDLLQHRVGGAADVVVAGEQQHGQAVGVGDGGGGDHVGGTRADRGGGDHDLPALLRLGVGDGGQRHGLLVLAAPGGELVLHGFERFGEAGDVAVAEDGENAREERLLVTVDHDPLVDQVLDQCLGHRQSDRPHRLPPRSHCGGP
jgi:hypothetical protein